MTMHFADPYVAAVYATLTSSPRGCARAELLAENPEEITGDFNAALRELHRAGLTAVAAGRYVALSKPMPPREDAPAAQPNADAQVAEAATQGTHTTSGVATPDASAPVPAAEGSLATAFAADMRAMRNAAPVQPQEKDTPMPKTAPPAMLPRHVVLAALRDIGPATAERVREACETLESKAVANALYRLAHEGHVAMSGAGRAKSYRITSSGAAQIQGKAATAPQAAAPRAAKPAGKGRATPTRKTPPKAAKKALALAVPPTREPEVLPRPAFAPEGFRCGLFSDGGLAIIIDDAEMHLDAVQTRALIGFLEHTTVLRAAS